MGNCEGRGKAPNIEHVTFPSDLPVSFGAFYTLKEEIGRGGFSVVYRSIENETDQEVAVKVCNRINMSEVDDDSLRSEVEVMKKLHHPNIVSLLDFMAEDDFYYIVMEYLAYGDLFNKLIKCVTFNEKQARDAIRAILKGLKHMHDANIAHRDLKPENLLLTSSDEVFSDIKIGDFGFAKWRREGDLMSTRLGSPSYVAPEILHGQPYTKAVDMWSMGIITFILLGGYPPFQHTNQRKLFKRIKSGVFEFHSRYWDNVSPQAKDLISSMLITDAEKRLTVDQALHHPWFQVTENLLQSNSLSSSLKNLRLSSTSKSFKLKSVVHTVNVSAQQCHRAAHSTWDIVASPAAVDEEDPATEQLRISRKAQSLPVITSSADSSSL